MDGEIVDEHCYFILIRVFRKGYSILSLPHLWLLMQLTLWIA